MMWALSERSEDMEREEDVGDVMCTVLDGLYKADMIAMKERHGHVANAPDGRVLYMRNMASADLDYL
jgi:hypothetical protein